MKIKRLVTHQSQKPGKDSTLSFDSRLANRTLGTSQSVSLQLVYESERWVYQLFFDSSHCFIID
jgi:hypothetical protein